MFRKKNKKQEQNNIYSSFDLKNEKVKMTHKLFDNVEKIKTLLDEPSDLTFRQFKLGETKTISTLVYLEGLVNKQNITDMLQSLYENKHQFPFKSEKLVTILQEEVLTNSSVSVHDNFDDVFLALLSGDTILLIDGLKTALSIGTKEARTRSISEPVTEAVVRGPKEGFTEDVHLNTVLMRQRIRDTNLRFESFKVGRRSKKDLIISYIDGVVNPDIVREVKRRLKTIDIDDAPDSGIIEQWIEDNFMSPFPQVQNTERPDRAVSSLVEGRVAILLDNTPFVLLVPVTLSQLLQSPSDYYERWWSGFLLRPIRYMSAFIALFLPAIYIALVSFHPGMIPSKLAFSIAATREGVPVPAFIEAILMELTMDLLREAGIRLPKPIGQTIGIVGGLVIGEAAVSAGIVSPIMVIIVALTAIASFSMPSYSLGITFRVLRYGFMLAAATFGLYGIIIGYIMINIHLANLKSFGVPYTTPFSPMIVRDWKDLLFHFPYVTDKKRPGMLNTTDPNKKNS